MLRLLIDKLNEIEFDPSNHTKSIIQLNILDMLCYCSQDTYPYHLQNVISNDQLYGADKKFINEINEISTDLLNDLLQTLQKLSPDRLKLQCQIALDLFERVATKADLCDDRMFSLAVNLWNLSIKNRHMIDGKPHHKTFRHLEAVRKTLRNRAYCQRFDELLNRIQNKL